MDYPTAQDDSGKQAARPAGDGAPAPAGLEDSYHAVTRLCPDGIIAFDATGRIIECNEAAARLTGYEPARVLGKHASELMVKPVPGEFPLYWGRLLQEGVLEGEFEVRRFDGTTVPVWAKAAAIQGDDGRLSRAITYLRDIADIRQTDSLKEEVIDFICQDMRTPLTVIIGAVSTVLTESPHLPRQKTQQLLQDAVGEAEELADMLSNLLELSQLREGRLPLVIEEIDVEALVNRAVQEASRKSPVHHFVTDLRQRNITLSADPGRLEHALRNLLENAARLSPRGAEIRLEARRSRGQVIFSICDQGPGIPEADRAMLLKPANPLRDRVLAADKGTGLSLLVWQKLIEAHGGHIRVESSPGHGSIFSFSLPVRRRPSSSSIPGR